MASKTWNIKTFGPSSLYEALTALDVARAADWDFELSLKFMAYYVEQGRQTGFGGYLLENTFRGALRSGCRFATGPYGPLYLRAGRRLLEQSIRFLQDADPKFTVWPGAPAEVIWDYLEDHK